MIILKRLGELFNFPFVDLSQAQNYHFRDLDAKLLEFLALHKNVKSLTLEGQILKNFINKLIISLHTSEEYAFKNNSRILIDMNFRRVVSSDLKLLAQMQNPKEKTFISWVNFRDAMLDIKQEGKIYKFDNIQSLNSKISDSYRRDFLLEGLFGAALKCYSPSIALSYFYTIKSVYILVRLLSIYIQLVAPRTKKHYENIYYIAAAALLSYENKFHILAQVPRSPPKLKNNKLSEETQAYYINHLLAGPQFLLLKMLEKTALCIAPLLG
jgi:hypothetical protein